MFEQAIDKETGEAVLVKRPSSFRTSLHFAGAPHSALHASWLCVRARARVCVQVDKLGYSVSGARCAFCSDAVLTVSSCRVVCVSALAQSGSCSAAKAVTTRLRR